jgi:hypothetical protein
MRKETWICDGCCSIVAVKSGFTHVEGKDLCPSCCRYAIRRYLESRGVKPFKSSCPHCEGTGRLKVVDEEATDAQATCGENRTQYKSEDCRECRF